MSSRFKVTLSVTILDNNDKPISDVLHHEHVADRTHFVTDERAVRMVAKNKAIENFLCVLENKIRKENKHLDERMKDTEWRLYVFAKVDPMGEPNETGTCSTFRVTG